MLSSWAKIIYATAGVLCAAASYARAEDAGVVRNIGVYADGTRGTALRAELTHALPGEVTPARSADVQEALAQAGIRDLRSAMSTEAGRARLAEAMQAVLSETKWDAIVLAHPERTKRAGTHARVLVMVSGEEKPRLDGRVDMPGWMAPAQRRARWKATLAAALRSPPKTEADANTTATVPQTAAPGAGAPGAGAPAGPAAGAPAGPAAGAAAGTTPRMPGPGSQPPEAAPPPASAPPSTEGDPSWVKAWERAGQQPEPPKTQPRVQAAPSPSAAPPTAEQRPPWLECGADRLWAYRDYAHTESTPQRSVRRYVASGVAGEAIHMEVRPFAWSQTGFFRGLGLALHGFTMGTFPSTGPGSYPLDDAPIPAPTTWYGGSAGLRWSMRSQSLVFGIGLGYGATIYDLDMPEEDREIPRGRYGMARLGTDLRIHLAGAFALTLSATYLHVLSIAPVTTYAPSTVSNGLVPAGLGVEGSVAVTMRLIPTLELRLGGQYEGIFYRADRITTPTGHPGTVRDQYVWLAAGARFTL